MPHARRRPRPALPPPGAAAPASARATAVAIAVAIVAAAGLAGCGPRLEPAPAPAPAAPGPAAPAARPAAPDPAAFAYGPGTETYVVERRAVVEVTDDAGLARDTVATRAVVRVSLAATRLTGTVDSFTVAAGDRVPAAPAATLPLPFSGAVDGGRVALDAWRDEAAVCRPDAAALAAAAELYPYVVPRPVGARWADTVIVEGCRGGVRVTTVAVHRYRGERQAQDGAPPLLRVERTTELTVRGAGRMARTAVTTEGTGDGRGTFLLDPAGGRLLEARTETTLRLTVDVGGRVERATQRAETAVRRR